MIFFKKRINIRGNYKASVCRKYNNFYLQEYISSILITTVLNAGAKPNAYDKESKIYEKYFDKNVDFFTLDLFDLPSDFKDRDRYIKGDLMDLSNVNKAFDLILLMSVMEHVANPFLMAEELKRIMHEKSYIYLAVPFFYPMHAIPSIDMDDYWRFTPSAIKLLFPYCNILELDYYPSVIRTIEDRKTYWDNEINHCTGFSMLLQNESK